MKGLGVPHFALVLPLSEAQVRNGEGASGGEKRPLDSVGKRGLYGTYSVGKRGLWW